MQESIIAGLDLGSTESRLVLVQKAAREEGERLQIVGATKVPTIGMNKGSIKSIEDVTSTITELIEKGGKAYRSSHRRCLGGSQ